MQADVDLPLDGDDVNITVKKTETCASKSKDSEMTYISQKTEDVKCTRETNDTQYPGVSSEIEDFSRQTDGDIINSQVKGTKECASDRVPNDTDTDDTDVSQTSTPVSSQEEPHLDKGGKKTAIFSILIKQ